ncbi:MAG: MBOAT family O-acyltransferase [Peptococcales bacterium]|jgi:alginate O-acetyltransferase complex protein AlgI
MLFHSPEFMILMTITLILFYLMPKARIYILAFANMLFYGASGLGYLVLFILVSVLTYQASRHLQGVYGKAFLWIGVLLNVFNLAFFKYSIFVLSNLEKFLPIKLVWENSFFTKLLLPVGISFYTFQMIAYLVDIYKGKIEPCKNLLDFWVFIAFFAQLIAGPIMRGKDLIPQVEELVKIRLDYSRVKLGLTYLALGLFKKIVLADHISAYADSFFNRGVALSGGEVWIAAYLFAFQIYFDFSAYSEMALGVGHLFGITLDLNFKTPYLSQNATEFWRRWHITLSNWIRDYVYIPLGGSRAGETRQMLNLLLAMTISGLWHGAAWTFVAWGMFHGLLLIGHKLYLKVTTLLGLNTLRESSLYRVFAIFIFFHLTCIGWVFFRAKGMNSALNMVAKMLTTNPFTLVADTGLLKFVAFVGILFLLHIVEYFVREKYQQISLLWHKLFPSPVRGLAYTMLIVILVIFMQNEQNSFIYFQF